MCVAGEAETRGVDMITHFLVHRSADLLPRRVTTAA
jgi:hypothetical protein